MTVGLFYRWEDHNHGLEHKCGTCATVLSSPRAKKTCFGLHEEVCPAYHKTLHFVGASHRCAACSNNAKAHSKRHHEIAEIIQTIRRLEGSSSTADLLLHNKRKSKKKDDSNIDPSDDGVAHLHQADPEREVEWDSNASTLINDDDDPEEKKQCWVVAMENPVTRKATKAQRKAAKNQVLFDVITQEELAIIEKVLHPQSEQQASAMCKGQGLVDNSTIDENIAFNANTFKWGQLRQRVHAKKTAKANVGKQRPNTPEEENRILSPIFAQFGISMDISKANRERKSLDTKLRVAILGDLVAFDNDQVETMQRMAGYWRFVNRRVYNEMVRNNELWDWATGEKLPEIREEADLDVIEEEAKDTEDGTHGVEVHGQVPENWNDSDLEITTGVAILSPASLADRLNNKREVDSSDTELSNDVGLGRDRIISISEFSSSPGHRPVQNLSFNVVSPVSANEAWTQDLTKEDSKRSTPRSPLSPMSSNPKDEHEKGFHGVKDTRVFGKAIRNASPPPLKDLPRIPQTFKNPYSARETQPRDPLNRFSALDNEVPAPCDEVENADRSPSKSVTRISMKPFVKKLIVQEDDWKIMRRSKGKEQVAGNVHAKTFIGGGGRTFAAVVKKKKGM